MTFSFLAPFIAASVILVPKTGVLEKSQTEIPRESVYTEESVKSSKPQKEEGEIILKRAPKPKVVKAAKGKKSKLASKGKKGKGKKNVAQQEEAVPKTEFENENLDDIYKKERKYFESEQKDDPAKRKAATVKGPLASIPTEVVNSMLANLHQARVARVQAATPPPPPPVKKGEQTDEGILTGDGTIANNSAAKLAKKLPPKKVVYKEVKVQAREFNPVELKNEVQAEVLLAESKQPKSARIPASVEVAPISNEPKDLLKKVESKYITQFVKIDVKSEVTQALLEKTKTYSGELFLAPEGRFKMQISEPNKHMLLMNGKNIWVVDYPLDETQDKVQILHSKSAKNLKNQAFLDIFMGVGNLQKKFKIDSSDKKNDEVTYKLIPKQKDEQIERVELKLNSKDELISSITFWDSLGNKTQLQFKKQEFKSEVPKEIFKFKPPKDSSITYL